jgi:hypothetical protein
MFMKENISVLGFQGIEERMLKLVNIAVHVACSTPAPRRDAEAPC